MYIPVIISFCHNNRFDPVLPEVKNKSEKKNRTVRIRRQPGGKETRYNRLIPRNFDQFLLDFNPFPFACQPVYPRTSPLVPHPKEITSLILLSIQKNVSLILADLNPSSASKGKLKSGGKEKERESWFGLVNYPFFTKDGPNPSSSPQRKREIPICEVLSSRPRAFWSHPRAPSNTATEREREVFPFSNNTQKKKKDCSHAQITKQWVKEKPIFDRETRFNVNPITLVL